MLECHTRVLLISKQILISHKNNLIAIYVCMFTAHAELLDEDGDAGVGISFREPELKYLKSVRVSTFDRIATMNMRYAGHPFRCVISLDAIEDFHRTNFSREDELASTISDVLHLVDAAIERKEKMGIEGGKIMVDYNFLDPQNR